MVAVTQARAIISLDQFLQYPEIKPYGEYFNGKIEQKPMPQGKHSILQGRLVSFINDATFKPTAVIFFNDYTKQGYPTPKLPSSMVF